MSTGNRNNTRYEIFTALASFTPSLVGNILALCADITGIKKALIRAFSYSDYVAGVNGVYTTASEGTVVIGTTYTLVVHTTKPGQGAPYDYKFQATAATTSFTDLATLFVAVINAITDFPGVAAVSTSHLRITEVPPSGYGAGGVICTPGAIVDNNTGLVVETAANWGTTTAHVTPVGDYSTLQRLYTASQSVNGQPIPNPAWRGNGPTLNDTFNQVTIQYVQNVGDPNLDPGLTTWTIYFDATILTTAEKAYIKGVLLNYQGQLGFGAGGNLPMTPIATAAAGAALIPLGVNVIAVTGNASNFIGIPAGYPVGTTLQIVLDATAVKISTSGSETINSGTAAGSATIAASTTSTLVKTSATNWLGTSQLNSGAGTVTAFPATS